MLYFDKFIKLNNIKAAAFISPPMTKSPDYRLKGKSVIIRLKEKPKPETTPIVAEVKQDVKQ